MEVLNFQTVTEEVDDEVIERKRKIE